MTSVKGSRFTDVVGYFYLSFSDSDTIQCSVNTQLCTLTFVDPPTSHSGVALNGVVRDARRDDEDEVHVHYSQIRDETITIHGAKSHHSSQVKVYLHVPTHCTSSYWPVNWKNGRLEPILPADWPLVIDAMLNQKLSIYRVKWVMDPFAQCNIGIGFNFFSCD